MDKSNPVLSGEKSFLSSVSDWRGFQRFISRAVKDFGQVEEIIKGNEVHWTMPIPLTRATMTTRAQVNEDEDRFFKIMWESEVKEMARNKSYHTDNCRRFTKFLFDKVGTNLNLQCRLDPMFEAAFGNNEVGTLWNILKKVCTTSSLEDYDDMKNELYRMEQGRRSLANYCLDLEDKVGQLAVAGIEIEPITMRDIFIGGLNKDIYGNKIAEMKFMRATEKDKYPKDYLGMKQTFRLWSDAHGITGATGKTIQTEKIMVSEVGKSNNNNKKNTWNKNSEKIKNGEKSSLSVEKSTSNTNGGKADKKNPVKEDNKLKENRVCFYCNKVGHIKQNCFAKKKFDNSKNNGGYNGKSNEKVNATVIDNEDDGEYDVIAMMNEENSISESEEDLNGEDNRGENVVITESNNAKVNVESNEGDNVVLNQSIEIHFDTAATNHVINNKDLLTDIRVGKASKIRGVNGKITNVNMSGLLGVFGMVYLMENAIVSIFSMKRLKRDGWKVHYDNDLDQFTINKQDISIKFVGNISEFYTWRIDRDIVWNGINLEKNDNVEVLVTEHYSKEQLKRAKEAMELVERLNYPSDAPIIKLLDNGGILNCKLTSVDLKVARKVYGPSVAAYSGKVTAPEASSNNNITSNVVGERLHIDIFYLNGARIKTPYMMTVDDCTGHVVVLDMLVKSTESLLRVMKYCYRWYRCSQDKSISLVMKSN